MIILADDDTPIPSAPSSSGISNPATPVVDDTPLSALSLIVIRIYAFGGLAFMASIVSAAFVYWVWIVIIKREFADSPPELDLHPERMKEREKARVERIKKRKEEKKAARKCREREKFLVPPLQYEKKDGIRLTSSTPSNRKSSISGNFSSRKSSASGPLTKSKRVSWASSASTLDGNGNLTERPLEDEVDPGSISQFHPPFRAQEGVINPIPRARTSLPHSSTSIEDRSAHGQGMVAATTPDVVTSWAMPVQGPRGQCTCSESVDPLDVSKACGLHRYRY